MNMEMAKNAFKPATNKRLHLCPRGAFPSPSTMVAYRFILVQIFRKKVLG
jgi:hypothetical protein